MTERHHAYRDAKALICDLVHQLSERESETLERAVDELLFSFASTGAFSAFADAEEQIALLRETERISAAIARMLLEAIASTGPERLIAA